MKNAFNKPFTAFFFTILVTALLFSLLSSSVAAHKPRVVTAKSWGPEGVGHAIEVTVIHDPEVSQAFYGELNGDPALFEIDAKQPFAFYAGLLVPDLPGASKDFQVKVIKVNCVGSKENAVCSSEDYALLNGSAPASEWKTFFEEFAGDDYLQGPETRSNASPAFYHFEVSNPATGNRGKYVLAVGETESFSPADVPSLAWDLPVIKSWFFGKPSYAAFTEGKMGPLLFVSLVVGVLVIAAIIFLVWKRLKKRGKR